MAKQYIRYKEGQWFLVPLQTEGYTLGLVARGSYKTKILLGYFFGTKYSETPRNDVTLNAKSEDAILIAWLGDLRIINGKWPIISSSRPFKREEWPIPKFRRESPLTPGKEFIIEYGENPDGQKIEIRETLVPEDVALGLPEDGLWGADLLASILTRLIKTKSS